MVKTGLELQKERPFVIENNIYKGPVRPIDKSYKNVGEKLLAALRKNDPDRVCMVKCGSEEVLTYKVMENLSVKCAVWMKKQGIGVGDVVGFYTKVNFQIYGPYLATLYVGGVLNTYEPMYRLQYARHHVHLLRMKMIFTDGETAEVMREAAKLEKVDVKIITFEKVDGFTSLREIYDSVSEDETRDFECEHFQSVQDPIASIFFTSGTTGPSKGVIVTHRGLRIGASDLSLISSSDILLFNTSLSWGSSSLLFIMSLIANVKLVVPEDSSVESTLKAIEKYKVRGAPIDQFASTRSHFIRRKTLYGTSVGIFEEVTWMFTRPNALKHLAESELLQKYDWSSLRTINVTGAVMKAELQKFICERLSSVDVFQTFGMTELTAGVMGQTKEYRKYGSSGIVRPNIQAKVISRTTGETLPQGKIGELCIKSPTATTGFYKNPSATRELIDDDGWLHSGDLVYFDEDGEIFFLERIKELIKCKGFHVSPVDIEAVLLKHPAVEEVCVVSVPDRVDEEHPFAFVIKRPGFEVTEKELKDLVAKTLEDQHQLRGGVKFLETFPFTPSEKIARSALKRLARETCCLIK